MRPTPAPLPDLAHLTADDYERVYEPSDDTYLLVDALAGEFAGDHHRPTLCLEVGSGSGCVITSLARTLSGAARIGVEATQSSAASAGFLATDINPAATAATLATARANRVAVEVMQMDLLEALRPGLIDVIIFNPPYVPTSAEEATQVCAHCTVGLARGDSGSSAPQSIRARLAGGVGARYLRGMGGRPARDAGDVRTRRASCLSRPLPPPLLLL